ncbi:MAG: hypothetical protein H0U53_10120 [Actinobacteria bacterium]|nr:hypothetical protein [Actinomycetota bacterium]
MRYFRSSSLWVAYFTVCFSMLFVAPASAYIDPASGSIIFQAVVGGAMAVGLGIKLFWRRIAAFFSRKR